VHPAAAEPGDLPGSEQAGHRPGGPDPAEHPAGQVGLQAAEGLAGQDVEPDGDQRAGLGIQDLVQRGGPGQPVAAEPAGVADRHDLQVLGERVVDLPVARDDLPLQVGHVDQRLAGQLVHARDQFGQGPGHHEIGPALLERLHRGGGAGPDPGQGEPDVLAGQIGVLLRTRQRELLLDDLLGQHEPRVVIAALPDRRQCAQGVEAREVRRREPLAAGVEPHRRGPGQDPDAVPGPDRVPVLDALGVVPHPVAVDQPAVGPFGDG